MTRTEIEEALRRRILRGLQAGSLRVGDRLPSARQYAAEFDVDYRVVLAAYKTLVTDNLVELRPRGGVYVARPADAGATLGLAQEWIEEVFAQGLTREIPLLEVAEWLRRCVDTLRLRAAVVASTHDQVAGLCRELHDDYGLEAAGELASSLQPDGDLPTSLRSAHVLVTTTAHDVPVRALAERLGIPCVVAVVRPDLIAGEWRLMLRRPTYVVVSDEGFEAMVRRFFAGTPEAKNLRIIVLGRDDPSAIPSGAPTYITGSARLAIGDRRIAGRIAGRIVPAARLLSGETARELISFIVRRNLETLRAQHR